MEALRAGIERVNWSVVGISLHAGAVVAGRYRLERLLGQGGMGAVWAATHTVTRRAVAMKFVRGPAHSSSDLRHRLLREARASTGARHPNVVDVLDVFELDEGTPVMVMDLLTGVTLGQHISDAERLGVAETACLLLPVVSAVGTAHARGIVHRDLTPENIFLVRGEGGQVMVKVLDFGIAKLADVDALTIDGSRGLVTQAGVTLGTPCYMAPEQAVGDRELDHRVDVWALGVILYECLSGIRPIDGETVGQVVMRLMSTGITPLERVVSGLPEDLTALIARMLARERSRRPADLREVAEVLRRHTDLAVSSDFGAPKTELTAPDVAELAITSQLTTSRPYRPGWTTALIAAAAIGLGGAAVTARATSDTTSSPAVATPNHQSPAGAPVASPTTAQLTQHRAPLPRAPSAQATKPPKPATSRAALRRVEAPATSVRPAARAPRGLAETPPF